MNNTQYIQGWGIDIITEDNTCNDSTSNNICGLETDIYNDKLIKIYNTRANARVMAKLIKNNNPNIKQVRVKKVFINIYD